ncbi:hypothetical protein NBJODN_NBJODN_13935, partial [Dysosmobacter welbionis]
QGGVGGADVALLMLRLADEVAQPVGEVFSVSGGGDVVPCGLVQVAQGHAGPQHGLRQLV